jgi:hypothetical protein
VFGNAYFRYISPVPLCHVRENDTIEPEIADCVVGVRFTFSMFAQVKPENNKIPIRVI